VASVPLLTSPTGHDTAKPLGLELPLAAGHRPKPRFPKDEAGFLGDLRRRVDSYFAERGRAARDNWQMYLKTALILAWYAVSYALLVFVAESWWQAVPLAVLLAGAMGAVAFNIQHDGGHHAYSRHEWVNRLAAWSLDFVGASSYLWKWKHVVMHHTFPNVDGQDTDIEAGAVARLAPHQPRRWFHRWQHLYIWPLYAVTSSRWHLYGDFQEVVRGKIGPHPIPRPKGGDLLVFLLGKAVSIALPLVVPMFFHDWWVVLLYYFFITGVLGLVVTVVFQLAHCVEEAEFPTPTPDTNRLSDSWAVHQIRTTVDFARTSRLACWLFGGLNFQVVHHLFPQVCHVHYPVLSRIVEETCGEYGVPYHTHPTVWAGVTAHYRWLKRMGRPDAAGATAA